MRRVPRWWAGKGPAENPQINRSVTDLSALSMRFKTTEIPESLRRFGAIKNLAGRAHGALTAPESWSVVS
ncbi:hypothetical protein XHV734_0952 [Xanthomonas hortorum pv. vitians]|nr:hypothetical protein XHV734_0952 [Xanthomonas hortorum pv. vitians]